MALQQNLEDTAEQLKLYSDAAIARFEKGEYAFYETLKMDWRKELNKQINVRQELEAKSRKLEAAYRVARDELNKYKGRLSSRRSAAEKEILRLHE